MIDKFVKTRKEHICDSCTNTIPIGSKVIYMAFKVGSYENRFEDGYEYSKQIGIKYHNIYICETCTNAADEELEYTIDMFN